MFNFSYRLSDVAMYSVHVEEQKWLVRLGARRQPLKPAEGRDNAAVIATSACSDYVTTPNLHY